MTGREQKYQQEVPAWLRACVPARYGVEIVSTEEVGQILVISDQLSNRHVDSLYDGRLVGAAAAIDAAIKCLSAGPLG